MFNKVVLEKKKKMMVSRLNSEMITLYQIIFS